MKSLIGVARNYRHNLLPADEDGHRRVAPEIEAVLTLAGRRHVFSGTNVVIEDFLKTVRFRVDVEGARLLAESAAKWADEVEAEAASLTVEVG